MVFLMNAHVHSSKTWISQPQFMACPNKGIKIHTFVVDCFYISLFYAFEQTNCTLVASDSKWVTFLLYVLNIYPSGVFTALAGAMWNYCYLGTFCVHHTTMHHATSFHAKPHMYGACVFNYNLPPALLAEWQGSFTCYCSNKGVEIILK